MQNRGLTFWVHAPARVMAFIIVDSILGIRLRAETFLTVLNISLFGVMKIFGVRAQSFCWTLVSNDGSPDSANMLRIGVVGNALRLHLKAL